MKKEIISVTEAARHFADCVNRAHYQKTTFVLLKNGVPFAQLSPENEKRCTGRMLAKALAKNPLPVEVAREWHRDLARARKMLIPPSPKKK